MGCFFACFRIRDDGERRNRHLLIPTSNRREPAVLNNQLASVHLCEEKGSPDERVGNWRSAGEIGKDGVDEELKREFQLGNREEADCDISPIETSLSVHTERRRRDFETTKTSFFVKTTDAIMLSKLSEAKVVEAKFLRSIGILQETPAEIRELSNRTNCQATDEGSSLRSSSFHSGTLCKKLDWDKQLLHVMDLSAQQQENSRLGESKPGGCKPEEPQTSKKDEQSQLEPGAESISLDISPTQSESPIEQYVSCHSPYPTPTNLTEEMQTPGTVYPASLESVRSRKDARIRTQYVYPILNPVENLSQGRALKGHSAHSAQLCELYEKQTNSSNPDIYCTTLLKDSELPDIPKTPSPADMKNQNLVVNLKEEPVTYKCFKSDRLTHDSIEQVCSNTDCSEFVVSSLSNWLKPPLCTNEQKVAKEHQHSEKTPDADRPIIGLVAAHWNGDPGQISHRWWDGNGIPNSTNKYKEDQKVSWHATPFEERLEKALSDEKLYPQRKVHNGKPIEFEDDGEESDTAAS